MQRASYHMKVGAGRPDIRLQAELEQGQLTDDASWYGHCHKDEEPIKAKHGELGGLL